MNKKALSKEEAKKIASEQARLNLRHLIKCNDSDILDNFVIETDLFWIFFRNKDITIPPFPNRRMLDDCAYAVGKHGLVLFIANNLDQPDELDHQVISLKSYFRRKDL